MSSVYFSWALIHCNQVISAYVDGLKVRCLHEICSSCIAYVKWLDIIYVSHLQNIPALERGALNIDLQSSLKSLSVSQPIYLHLLLQQYQPVQSLHSGDKNLLARCSTTSKLFYTFSVEYLLLSIRSVQTLDIFQSPKTCLFTQQ